MYKTRDFFFFYLKLITLLRREAISFFAMLISPVQFCIVVRPDTCSVYVFCILLVLRSHAYYTQNLNSTLKIRLCYNQSCEVLVLGSSKHGVIVLIPSK